MGTIKLPTAEDLYPSAKGIDPPKPKKPVRLPTMDDIANIHPTEGLSGQIQDYRYEDFDFQPKLGQDNYKLRAQDQGWGEQLAKSIGNTIANIPMGIAEAFAYIPELFDKDHDYTNFAVEKLNEWRNPFGEVYRENPNQTFDFSDPAWWFNNGFGLVESIAEFAIPGATAGKLLGTLAKGATTAMKLGATAEKIGQGIAAIGTSGYLGYTEGAMSGRQIFKEVYNAQYEKLTKSGMDPMQADVAARKQAAEGAAATVGINTLVNTTMNMLAIAPMFGNAENKAQQWITKNGRQVGEEMPAYRARMAAAFQADPALKAALKYRKGYTSGVANMAGEGIEEVNTQYAEETGREVGGIRVKKNLDGISDYFDKIGNQEGLLNFVMGAIGGVGEVAAIDAIPIHRVRAVDPATGKYILKPGNDDVEEGTDGKQKYKMKFMTSRTRDAQKQAQYFHNAKDAILHDIDWYMGKDAELKAATASNNHFQANKIRQEMLNVANLNTIITGNADSWKQQYDEISGLDNKVDLGDAIQAQIDKMKEGLVLAKTPEEKAAIEQATQTLTAQFNKVSGKTAAMQQGFARDTTDNAYKEKARTAVKDLELLKTMHDDLRANYLRPDEDKSEELVNHMFVRQAEQHFNKRIMDEEESSLAKDELIMSTINAHAAKIEVANEVAKELNTDRTALVQAVKDNNFESMKQLAGKYGIVANNDKEVAAAVGELADKLEEREAYHAQVSKEADQLLEDDKEYNEWREKHPGKNYQDFLNYRGGLNYSYIDRKKNLDKAREEWNLSQQGLDKVKSKKGIGSFLKAAQKHAIERKTKLAVKFKEQNDQMFLKLNDKVAAAAMDVEEKETVLIQLKQHQAKNIKQSNSVKAKIAELQKELDEISTTKGVFKGLKNMPKKSALTNRITSLEDQLKVLQVQADLVQTQIDNVEGKVEEAKANVVVAATTDVEDADKIVTAVDPEPAQTVGVIVDTNATADPDMAEALKEKAELEELIRIAEAEAIAKAASDAAILAAQEEERAQEAKRIAEEQAAAAAEQQKQREQEAAEAQRQAELQQQEADQRAAIAAQEAADFAAQKAEEARLAAEAEALAEHARLEAEHAQRLAEMEAEALRLTEVAEAARLAVQALEELEAAAALTPAIVFESGMQVDPVLTPETITPEQAQATIDANVETQVDAVVENTVTDEDIAVIAQEENISEDKVKRRVADVIKSIWRGTGIPQMSRRLSIVVKRILAVLSFAGIAFFAHKSESYNTVLSKITDIVYTAPAKDTISFSTTQYSVTPFDGCAAWTHDQIKSVIGSENRQVINLFGDAWTSTSNMVHAGGGSYVYNVFTGTKPALNTADSIGTYIKEQIAAAPKLSVGQMKAGDIVNLFYEGSSFTVEAFKDGKGVYTTHLGIIKENSEGMLVVEHNIHGIIHTDNLQKMLDGKVKSVRGQVLIAAVARPNYEKLGYIISHVAPKEQNDDNKYPGSTPWVSLTTLLAFLKKRREEGNPLTPAEIQEAKDRLAVVESRIAEMNNTAKANYEALKETLPGKVLDQLDAVEAVQRENMSTNSGFSYDAAQAGLAESVKDQSIGKDTAHDVIIKQKEFLENETVKTPVATIEQTVPEVQDKEPVQEGDYSVPSDPLVPVINAARDPAELVSSTLATHGNASARDALKNNTASIEFMPITRKVTLPKGGEKLVHKSLPLYANLDPKANHNILKPGFIKSGDAIEFRVDTTFNGEINYDKTDARDAYGKAAKRPDKFANHTTPQGKIVMNSEEDGYANVPIAIVHASSGQVIGYVPRTDWVTAKFENTDNYYHIVDVVKNPETDEWESGNVEFQKQRLLAARRKISEAFNAGKGQKILSVVNSIGPGHLFYNQDVNTTQETAKIVPMMAETLVPEDVQIAIVSKGSVKVGKGVDTTVGLNHTEKELREDFGTNSPALMLPMPNGMYTLSPLITRSLGFYTAGLNTIARAVEAYMAYDPDNANPKHEALREKIREATSHPDALGNATANGFDIMTEEGLENFINQYFTYTTHFETRHVRPNNAVKKGESKRPTFMLDIPKPLPGEKRARIKIGVLYGDPKTLKYASVSDGVLDPDFERKMRDGLGQHQRNVTYTSGQIRGINDKRPFNSIIVTTDGTPKVTKHANYNAYLKHFATTIVYGKHQINKEGKEAGVKNKLDAAEAKKNGEKDNKDATFVYGANPVITYDLATITETPLEVDATQAELKEFKTKQPAPVAQSSLSRLRRTVANPNSGRTVVNKIGTIEGSMPASLENLNTLREYTPADKRNDLSPSRALEEMHDLGITEIAPDYNPFLKC